MNNTHTHTHTYKHTPKHTQTPTSHSQTHTQTHQKKKKKKKKNTFYRQTHLKTPKKLHLFYIILTSQYFTFILKPTRSWEVYVKACTYPATVRTWASLAFRHFLKSRLREWKCRSSLIIKLIPIHSILINTIITFFLPPWNEFKILETSILKDFPFPSSTARPPFCHLVFSLLQRKNWSST